VPSSYDYKRVLRQQFKEYESVGRESSANKDVNKEAEEATGLETVTRRQPVKIQQNEKASYVL
jgi:hypothetical protein